jgi:hypothetical protein
MKSTILIAAVLLSVIIETGSIARGQTISAALVRPWGGGIAPPVGAFWNELSTNWSTYGTVPITLNRTTFVSASVITASALFQANPDVLIFADSAGSGISFTPAEQVAVSNFVMSGGKRIIATFVAFSGPLVDNRWLLPLFGLDPNLNLVYLPHGGQAISFTNPSHTLAANIPATMPVSGYSDAHTPADFSWDPADYVGELIASSQNNRNIVHHYGAQTHDAVYISFMPEYGGNADAVQLIYNCITAALPTLPTLTPLALPQIGTVFPISVQSASHPNAGYLVGFAVSPSPGFTLSDGRVIPLAMDPLLQLSLTPNNGIFLHTTGFLDGSGMASAWVTVSIPALPSLVGQSVYAAMITLDSSAVTGVGGISNALPIVIVN